jgi:hypothetical protein
MNLIVEYLGSGVLQLDMNNILRSARYGEDGN